MIPRMRSLPAALYRVLSLIPAQIGGFAYTRPRLASTFPAIPRPPKKPRARIRHLIIYVIKMVHYYLVSALLLPTLLLCYVLYCGGHADTVTFICVTLFYIMLFIWSSYLFVLCCTVLGTVLNPSTLLSYSNGTGFPGNPVNPGIDISTRIATRCDLVT